MQIYSVDQILSVRDKFKELPYPGFSLDEVIRRKRQQAGHKVLTRGEKAWSSKVPKSLEEGIRRRVQSELNKLAPEKYSEVMKSLLDDQFFSSNNIIDIVANIIFRKALEEPGYSELYARLCYDIAKHELEIQQNDDSSTDAPLAQIVAGEKTSKKKSCFRSSIISLVYNEFSTNSAMKDLCSLSADMREYEEARLIRRKKANIKLIGQLYMRHVLFAKTMIQIMDTLVKSDLDDNPECIDLEVLSELLETIGKTIDTGENVVLVDNVINRLKELQNTRTNESENKFFYPPRIRFKIMDLVETRQNHWDRRVQRADLQTPTTLQEQAKKQVAAAVENQKKLLLSTAKPVSPNTVSTPTNRRATSNRFPSCPGSTSSFIIDSPANNNNNTAPWRTVTAPARDTPTSLRYSPNTKNLNPDNDEQRKKAPSFATKVKELMNQWLNDNVDESIPDWRETLRCDEVAESDLSKKIVFVVIHEACTITLTNAQQSACYFLIRGLELEDDELYGGLASVLTNAIEIGLMEDVPKFNERFTRVLNMMAGQTEEEFYIHGARILYDALSKLEPAEEMDNMSPLLSVWKTMEKPDAPLSIKSLSSIIAFRGANQEKFAAYLIKALLDKNAISEETILAWSKMPEANAAVGIVEELIVLNILKKS